MKNFIHSIFFLLAAFALGSMVSCQKEPQKALVPAAQKETERYTAPVDLGEVSSRSSCPWTVIPAGSVNALAAAIASTCDDGVIYLKAGLHTENSAVTINKPVKVIGEQGAVLKMNPAFSVFGPNNEYTLHSGLHILNAPNTLLQDIDIRPTGADAGTAVFIENSPGSAIIRCRFTNYQYAAWVHNSDRVALMYNFVHASGLWLTGALLESVGFTVANGKSCYVSDNEIENALEGIWCCDKWGTAERNYCHDNLIGIICCKVPDVFYNLPTGQPFGAAFSATGWKVTNNTCTGNFDNGIMVIDGSNFNRVWNNQAHGNGLSPIAGTAADIESFGDSNMFGYLTPQAHDNYIDATGDPNTKVRNCGANNTFNGGIPIGGNCR